MFTCSNCGKLIPEAGHICPYCKADKTADLAALVAKRQALATEGKKSMALIATFLAGAILGGTIGWGHHHTFWARSNVFGWAGTIVGVVGSLAVCTAFGRTCSNN